jgi:hypothetical protein
MKRQITGLYAADRNAAHQVPDGIFLVRVQRARFCRQAQKPYYALTLAVLEPVRFSGQVISSKQTRLPACRFLAPRLRSEHIAARFLLLTVSFRSRASPSYEPSPWPTVPSPRSVRSFAALLATISQFWL